MGRAFFKWLYRLPGRMNRSIERTAIAASVVESEGPGQLQVDPVAMSAALSELEASEEEDSADAEPR